MNDKDYKTTCTVPEPVEGTTVGASTSSATEGKTTRLLTFVFSLLSLAFFVSSCSTEKNLGKSNLKSLSANQLIREIEDNRFEYENLEAKIGVNLKGNDYLGLKGQLRMQKDSVVWISLSLKFGIEVGRVMITPDSIKYINRSNKTYLVESIDTFKEKFPIDLSIQNIQDLLIGNDNNLRNSGKSRVFVENDKYNLEIMERENNLVKNVTVNPETFKIHELGLKDIENEPSDIKIKYDAFQNIDGRLLPSKIVFEGNKTTILQNHNINVEINYSDIRKGEKLDFPFNISSKFEQILIW